MWKVGGCHASVRAPRPGSTDQLEKRCLLELSSAELDWR